MIKPIYKAKKKLVYTVAAIAAIFMSFLSPIATHAMDLDLNLPNPGGGVVGQIIDFIFGWMWIVGIVVTAFGGIMLAISITNREAEAKASAVKVMVAGAIVTAIGAAVAAATLTFAP